MNLMNIFFIHIEGECWYLLDIASIDGYQLVLIRISISINYDIN
jgi:hypothetical protein